MAWQWPRTDRECTDNIAIWFVSYPIFFHHFQFENVNKIKSVWWWGCFRFRFLLICMENWFLFNAIRSCNPNPRFTCHILIQNLCIDYCWDIISSIIPLFLSTYLYCHVKCVLSKKEKKTFSEIDVDKQHAIVMMTPITNATSQPVPTISNPPPGFHPSSSLSHQKNPVLILILVEIFFC